jgi:hypothetical protein
MQKPTRSLLPNKILQQKKVEIPYWEHCAFFWLSCDSELKTVTWLTCAILNFCYWHYTMLAFISSYPSADCPILPLHHYITKFIRNRWEPVTNSPMIRRSRTLKRPCLLKGLVFFLSTNSKARFTNIWYTTFNVKHKYSCAPVSAGNTF